MAFMQRFKGRIAADSLSVRRGGLFDGASGVGGAGLSSIQGVLRLPLAVTAVANTDFTAAIPTGATILSAAVYTTTLFTAASITLQIGNVAGGVQYVAATSIISVGIVQLTLVNAAAAALASFPAPTAGANVFVRLVQGTPTAVGAGLLEIEYAA